MLSLFYMQGALDWAEPGKKSLRERTTIPYTFIVIMLLGPCHRLFMIALKFPICIIHWKGTSISRIIGPLLFFSLTSLLPPQSIIKSCLYWCFLTLPTLVLTVNLITMLFTYSVFLNKHLNYWTQTTLATPDHNNPPAMRLHLSLSLTFNSWDL